MVDTFGDAIKSMVDKKKELNTTNFFKVMEFHTKFNHLINVHPTWPSDDIVSLRLKLIKEEREELLEAVEENDIVAVADALTDLLYVIYGAGLCFGIDLDACFAEVHRSNMSKLGADGKPIYREDGKVLKGPNYTPPNLRDILFPDLIKPPIRIVEDVQDVHFCVDCKAEVVPHEGETCKTCVPEL